MINLKITIQNINYEQTFRNQFPLIMQKCTEMQEPSLALAFFKKMNDESMEIISDILKSITNIAMGRLLCSLIWTYEYNIVKLLNDMLRKNGFGSIHIGEISVTINSAEQILINICNVEVHYKELLHNKMVQKKIKEFVEKYAGILGNEVVEALSNISNTAAIFIVSKIPKPIEKLLIVWVKNNKKELLFSAKNLLDKNGICMDVIDFSL